MIKIALVDDQRINRTNRAEEFKAFDELNMVLTAQNGSDFLEQVKELSQEQRPELVLMDIDMPVMNGIETVQIAKTLYPEMEFLMFTVFDEDQKIFDAVKAGASGYLLKDEKAETIRNYILQVKEFGASPMSPSVARKALKLLSISEPKLQYEKKEDLMLSPREKEVLKGMVNGMDYKEIADSLHVSPNTVRNQIAGIYKKLHVTCKVEAVKIALRNNMI